MALAQQLAVEHARRVVLVDVRHDDRRASDASSAKEGDRGPRGEAASSVRSRDRSERVARATARQRRGPRKPTRAGVPVGGEGIRDRSRGGVVVVPFDDDEERT